MAGLCSVCFKSFRDESALEKHVQRAEDDAHREHAAQLMRQRGMPVDEIEILHDFGGSPARTTRGAQAAATDHARAAQFDLLSDLQPASPSNFDDAGDSLSDDILEQAVEKNLAAQEWPYIPVDHAANRDYFTPPPAVGEGGVMIPQGLLQQASSEVRQAVAIAGRAIELPPSALSTDNAPHFDEVDKIGLRLYDVLEHANCPLHVFDKVMELFRESPLNSGHQLDMIPSRSAFINDMMKRFKTCRPEERCIELESRTPQSVEGIGRGVRDEVLVVTCDFKSQLLDLLDDPLFHNIDNLVVDPQNPFGPYSPQKDTRDPTRHSIEEALDGTVCQGYLERLREQPDYDPGLDFPLVLQFYTDKTGTDACQRCGLEPFMFTLPIIRRHLRQDTMRTWRHLGFVPDLDLKSKASKAVSRGTKAGRGRSIRNCHKCLSAVLHSFLEAQKERPIVTVRLGNMVKKCRLRLGILFISGDGLSGDHLCGRIAGYGEGTKRLSRACNVTFDEFDDYCFECEVRRHKEILVDLMSDLDHAETQLANLTRDIKAGKCARAERKAAMDRKKALKAQLKGLVEELRDLYIYRHRNAFATAEFCDHIHGIFGSTPADPLHAFLLGVLQCACEVFNDQLTPTIKDAIDCLVDALLGGLRSMERPNFPRVNFKRGFTNLTMLTAHEWAGVALVYVIICNTRAGQIILDNMFAGEESVLLVAQEDGEVGQFVDTEERVPEEEKEEPPEEEKETNRPRNTSSRCTHTKFREIMEKLLCFYAWCKRGVFSSRDEESERVVREEMANMLADMTDALPRDDGNGWTLQKLHDLLHIARDFVRNGHPGNFDTGPMERGLRPGAKLPAKTAQKRGVGKFNMQTASRLSERHCMGKAHRLAGLPRQSKSSIEHACDEDSLGSEESVNPDIGLPFGGASPRFTIAFVPRWSGGRMVHAAKARVVGRCRQLGFLELHPIVVRFFDDWINQRQNHKFRDETIECYTQWSNKGVVFRAHPNCRSEGKWHDWAAVAWECGAETQGDPSGRSSVVGTDEPAAKRFRETDEMKALSSRECPIKHGSTMEPGREFPCMLLAFFNHPTEGECAVTHSAKRRTGELSNWQSKICEPWELEFDPVERGKRAPRLRHVSVNTITQRLFVVPESQQIPLEVMVPRNPEHSPRVLLIRDMEKHWPRHFTMETEPLETTINIDDDESSW